MWQDIGSWPILYQRGHCCYILSMLLLTFEWSQQKLMYQKEKVLVLFFIRLGFFAVDLLRRHHCGHKQTRTQTLTRSVSNIPHHRNHPQIDILFIHFSCWTLFFIGDYFPFKLIQSVSFFIAFVLELEGWETGL